jgi:hypothetical protein
MTLLKHSVVKIPPQSAGEAALYHGKFLDAPDK